MRLPAYLLGLLSVGAGLAGCADAHEPSAQTAGDQTALQNQTEASGAPVEAPAAAPVETPSPTAPVAVPPAVATAPVVVTPEAVSAPAPAADAGEVGGTVVASPQSPDAGAAPDSGLVIPGFAPGDLCLACGLG